MKQLTEQEIETLAPNAAAVSNAKKISQKGGFVKLSCSADDTFYMGECTGSGKSNYITSADFISPDSPVFRCTCPSRQFPCKHSLALMYEMLAGKRFEVCEIPQDILNKRAKSEARAEKKEEVKSSPPKINKTARTKKLKKQLEGLDMTARVVNDLLNMGLGTLGGNSAKTYRDLAKQLGDYYLPGPQLYIQRLILEIEALQQDSDEAHYGEAVHILIQLNALIKKARAYLNEKLESENLEDDDSILFEELGGVWQLDRLQQLGLKKENARLAQLSFNVYFDKARNEYVDLGYWADIDTGEIFSSRNYRPVKALKHIKAEDSAFELALIPVLTFYPGEYNRRARWDKAEFTPLTGEHIGLLRSKAYDDIASAVKAAKSQMKNILDDNYVAATVTFERIGRTQSGYALIDHTGGSIALSDRPGDEGTLYRLSVLSGVDITENQVLFGLFYYDSVNQRICLQPYSIITQQSIIRLLY